VPLGELSAKEVEGNAVVAGDGERGAFFAEASPAKSLVGSVCEEAAKGECPVRQIGRRGDRVTRGRVVVLAHEEGKAAVTIMKSGLDGGGGEGRNGGAVGGCQGKATRFDRVHEVKDRQGDVRGNRALFDAGELEFQFQLVEATDGGEQAGQFEHNVWASSRILRKAVQGLAEQVFSFAVISGCRENVRLNDVRQNTH